MKTAAFFLLCASPAMAEMTCTLQNTNCIDDCPQTTVIFDVDPNQFVAPLDPNDPPRRQITTVTLNGATFTAEAIMMQGGIVGFHEDAVELGSRLMIVQADGTARLTMQPSSQTLTGLCETS